ncbi:MAG TPA: alpha/beta fold hydrolase [Phycisphaerae bacterium]|nr:alpha/beta fold hydrolase [Phycisphaerae bacterium]
MLERHELDAAGRTWTYWVSALEPTARTPAPVVIVLHGSGGNGAESLVQDGWIEQAKALGFVAVAPDAPPMNENAPINVLTNPTIWNAGQPYVGPPRSEVDDMAFFGRLFEELTGRSDVDATRFFVAGHSSGGAMAFRLAAERAERVRGIAVVASPFWIEDPRPATGVPTIFIAGDADPIYPIAGGTQNVGWLQRTTPPASETLAQWAAAIGCSATPRQLDEATTADLLGPSLLDAARVEAMSYDDAGGDPFLLAIFLNGHGHRWPGGGTPDVPVVLLGPDNPPLDATQAILRFFASWGER